MGCGSFEVKRLRRSGKYVSALDSDKAFVDSDNPTGLFKMMVLPIENEIRYMRTANGYRVSGESYILGGNETEIERRARYYMKEKFPQVYHREVFREEDLW